MTLYISVSGGAESVSASIIYFHRFDYMASAQSSMKSKDCLCFIVRIRTRKALLISLHLLWLIKMCTIIRKDKTAVRESSKNVL